jgi:Tfp pilus assembly protein PilP
MTRAVQAAVVAAALGCGAPAPPVEAALHPQVRQEVSSESQSAAPATAGPSGSAIRDPFVRPVLTPSAPPGGARAAGEGLAAASFGDIVVRGIVQTRGDRVALVQTADGKHYRVRAGERLRDGRVQAVSTDGLLILPDPSAGGVRGPSPVLKPLGVDSREQ